MNIAILEDDVRQAMCLASLLGTAGYRTTVRHDGKSFLKLIEAEPVDMLLLDWEVPGCRGIDVLRWVRVNRPKSMPVLMLSGNESEACIVEGLENGADDYLVKPAGQGELLARIRMQLRNYYPDRLSGKKLTLGPYVLDAEARSVRLSVNGMSQLIHLPVREYALAQHLFRNVGRIVSKDELIKVVWGTVERRYDATLATYISKLRSSLELRAKNGVIVSTVYNHGYRLEELPKRRVHGNQTGTTAS
jgi:DNA-binding response OmpR family regulator